MDLLSDRLYDAYASTHAGVGSSTAGEAAYRRDIRPHLPTDVPRPSVLDIGCGQGQLVALLAADGLDAYGVDISREQVELAHRAGLNRVTLGDFRDSLRSRRWDAVVATDLLEHLDKAAVLHTFDDVRCALRPGGVFVARVPNAASPTGGSIMYGDITHQTWFTRRSVQQLAAVAGFDDVRVFSCPPPVYGVRSAVRAAVFAVLSAFVKATLIAETGQLRGHVVTQNLTFVARAGVPAGSDCGSDPDCDSDRAASLTTTSMKREIS